jgi:hypothetical protein
LVVLAFELGFELLTVLALGRYTWGFQTRMMGRKREDN